MEESKKFSYTYSAREQEEIKTIRQKYMSQEENKMEQLRRLDKNATWKGTVVASILGVIGAFFLGIGMCCTMVWSGLLFVPGIIIGIIGLIVIAVAYPLYLKITKKQREKLAPQIMKLTDELMR